MTISEVLAGNALLFSIVALCAALYACVKVLAFERSTHKVMMYDPNSDFSEEISPEEKEAMLKNSWEEDLIK